MSTPITNLDCEGFALALAEYLEPDAPEMVRAAVDSHAAQCDACRALLADLTDIRTQAAALPRLTPSHDLWSGIAERIDAPVIPMGVPSRAGRIGRTWRTPAIAAAALVVITAGLTHVLTRAYFVTPAPAGRVATATPVAPATPAPLVPNAVITSTATEEPPSARASAASHVRLASRVTESGEPVLDNEISKLRRIVSERRSQLDPRTIAILEQSMAVIDSAIAQSRAALAKDPASGFLATELNRSLEKKVELLRTATLLPAGT